jgi:PAS domain S-box-containing protein
MPEGRSVNVNAPQPAKGAFRPSEQDCRLIVDSIPGHVVTLTAHGDIEFVNQQWLDYLGKTLDELKSWTNGVVHPDDLSRAVATWNRSVETGQPYDSECRFCRADGVFRWFHIRAIPERDAEGCIVRWYGLYTDIDERKQAEDRLQLLLDRGSRVRITPGAPLFSPMCQAARADSPIKTKPFEPWLGSIDN